MSQYNQHLKEKENLKLKAMMARPEKPRYGDQINLSKHLAAADEHFDAQIRKEDKDSSEKMSKRWEGNGGGSRGDAFIDGLQSGLNKGSILDDKKRMQKFNSGMKKMEGMLQHTNEELARQENLFNAKEAMKPRIAAYLETAKSMSPDSKALYVQRAMDEYNNLIGTNYKVASVDGVEPWKVTAMDGDQAEIIDLMDFIKTPQEKRLELYMNQPGYQQMEGSLKAEHNTDQALKGAMLQQRQGKANEMNSNSPEGLQARKQELEASGKIPKGAMLFDEIKGPELKYRLEAMKEEIGKLKGAEDGIRALDKMEEIFDKHPNIATSLARWSNAKKEDSLMGNFLKDFVNEEERDAVIELDKHAATLALGTIQQFKGQRPTDILKKLIKDTTPGGNFTKGAFKSIKPQYIGDFEKQKKKSLEEQKGFRNRYFPSHEEESPVQQSVLQKADPEKQKAMIAEAQRRLNAGQ
jgi:hypothetical protein